MNLRWTELGKFAQNFLNRPSSSVVLHDGTDGEPTPFNNGSSSLHVRALFNVGMLSNCGSCLSSHICTAKIFLSWKMKNYPLTPLTSPQTSEPPLGKCPSDILIERLGK